MRYATARLQDYEETLTYRIYMSDGLQALVENTTHFATMSGMVDHGKTINIRWIDVIDKTTEEPQEDILDTMSCEDIALDIFKKMRGREDNGNECI